MEELFVKDDGAVLLHHKPGKDQPAVVRILAHFFSYVFHPLFLPAYVTAFLLYVHPYAFAGITDRGKTYVLIAVFFSTGFLPAFAVFLMSRLGLIKSIFLRTQKERIIPYAAAIVFYFWIWYVFRSQPDNPVYFVKFLLGAFLGVCTAWMFNITSKISMHATGVGGLLMFFLLQALYYEEATALYIAIAIIITGIVCTSRLIVSDHTQREVYTGLVAGIACQLVALWV